MNAFEEWWEKEMYPRVKMGETIYKGDCEKTWKAALEWISEIFANNEEQRCNIGADVIEKVLKELEE